MAFMQYLNFNGTDLPLPDSYDIDLSDVEADSSGETEAGTTQRDVVRSGVVKIAVSFSVSPAWLKKLTAYSKLPKITVLYFDTEDLEQKEAEMYISGYKAKLEKDTSYLQQPICSFEHRVLRSLQRHLPQNQLEQPWVQVHRLEMSQPSGKRPPILYGKNSEGRTSA